MLPANNEGKINASATVPGHGLTTGTSSQSLIAAGLAQRSHETDGGFVESLY
jgi:hypothetical protein